MADIAKNIFEAIDIIVDKKFKEADFSTAVVGKVISRLKGKMYLIKYQDMTIEAEALSSLALNSNDIVYILMPQNDLSAKKYIIGKTTGETLSQTESSGGGGGDVDFELEYATVEDIYNLFL